MTKTLKRGVHINTRFATGIIVPAVIVRRHKGDMSDWYVVRYLDDRGGTQSCHCSQITVTDNR